MSDGARRHGSFRIPAAVAIGCASACLMLAAAPTAAAASVPAAAPAAPRWRPGIGIRVPANARANPQAHLFALACARARSCAAGGSYQPRSGHAAAMVVSQAKGRWARARVILLPSNAASKPQAQVNSIACTTARSCVAVGSYEYGTGGSEQPFTAAESKGRWARARAPQLPPNAAAPSEAQFDAVACPAPRSCVAAGEYLDQAGSGQLMVAVQSRGRWGRARKIQAPENASPNPFAFIVGLACPRAGYCSAAGGYADSSAQGQALTVTESKGRWRQAAEVRLPASASTAPAAVLDSLACTGIGYCVAVGGYEDATGHGQVMEVTESNGTWRQATGIRLPANSSTAPGILGELFGVACYRLGSCVAVGGYVTSSHHPQAMAVTESGRRWRRAIEVIAPANAGTGTRKNSFLYSVACAKGGPCVAGGSYRNRSGHDEAMVATRSAP